MLLLFCLLASSPVILSYYIHQSPYEAELDSSSLIVPEKDILEMPAILVDPSQNIEDIPSFPRNDDPTDYSDIPIGTPESVSGMLFHY
jgi:hypothetical protein